MSKFSLGCSAFELVSKVVHYTKNDIKDYQHLVSLANMAEEAKLVARESLFKSQISIASTKEAMDGKDWLLMLDDSEMGKAKSNVMIYNRCMELLYAPLRDMLRPVWNVYWKESCVGLSSIAIWLLKADQDNGKEVFAKLEQNPQ